MHICHVNMVILNSMAGGETNGRLAWHNRIFSPTASPLLQVYCCITRKPAKQLVRGCVRALLDFCCSISIMAAPRSPSVVTYLSHHT